VASVAQPAERPAIVARFEAIRSDEEALSFFEDAENAVRAAEGDEPV
jgi:hypothetical protein